MISLVKIRLYLLNFIQDLQDKHTAFAICEENLQLNEFSPNISYKPDPCRPIKGQITPEEWLAFSKYNKDRAEKESRSTDP